MFLREYKSLWKRTSSATLSLAGLKQKLPATVFPFCDPSGTKTDRLTLSGLCPKSAREEMRLQSFLEADLSQKKPHM